MRKEISKDSTSVVLEQNKEKMTSVHIQSEDADIYVNGELVWQKYDNPEYAKIPPNYRAFVKERSNYMKDKGDKIEVDCHDRNIRSVATFYFPKNLRNPISVRFDLITSLEHYEADYLRNHTDIDDATADNLTAELKLLWKALEDEIHSYGWKFYYSHDDEGCWGWWDVVFKNSAWNEEHLLSVWKRIGNIRTKVGDINDQYSM